MTECKKNESRKVHDINTSLPQQQQRLFVVVNKRLIGLSYPRLIGLRLILWSITLGHLNQVSTSLENQFYKFTKVLPNTHNYIYRVLENMLYILYIVVDEVFAACKLSCYLGRICWRSLFTCRAMYSGFGKPGQGIFWSSSRRT